MRFSRDSAESHPRAHGTGRHDVAPVNLPALAICLALSWAAPTALAQPTDPTERAALAQHLRQSIAAAESFDDQYDAAVWLTDMQARLARLVPEAGYRLQLLRQIHAAATASELSPELVLAVIEVESHFDRFAVSRVGAQGYMQVMPFWKQEIGRPDDNLTDPETNLRYGCQILKFYIQREKGDLRRALAAYNGSSGSLRYPNKVFNAWRSHWKTTSVDW